MPKTIKSSDLITSYTSFEDGQVLTPGQLNGIPEYLDRQDRLTRTRLTGVGILCGLEPAFQGGLIRLSAGSGITTDGDLLSIDRELELSFFRPFQDKNALYPAFIKGGRQIGLYELSATALQNSEKLSSFETTTGKKPTEMALLLYLESYYFKPDICTGGDCDNKGQSFENNLRVLLAAKADLDRIPDGDYFGLDDLAAWRVLLDSSVTSYGDICDRYRPAITAGIKDLIPALEKSYKLLAPLLKDLYGGVSPLPGWKKVFDQISQKASGNAPGIQYIYSFILDLMTAFNELREATFHAEGWCIPPVDLFPKHLMLGSVAEDSSLPDDPYRHGLYKSPSLRERCEGPERIRLLHLRIHRMITGFAIPASQGVRITPDRDCLEPLGGRAIPYYYSIDPKAPLNRAWSLELERRRRSAQIPSYNASAYSTDDRILNPLNYQTAYCPFFRIEGHMGMDFREAEKALNGLITRFNLPIRVISLMVEKDITLLPFKPPFRFGDLRITHYLYRREIGLHLKDLADLNLKLDSMIQDTGDPQADSTTSLVDLKKAIRDDSGTLDTKIRAMSNRLTSSIADFDHEGFEKDYSDALQTAALVNKNVKVMTYNQVYTPYETFINTARFQGLRWLGDLLKQRGDRAKEACLFSNFLADHPGIEQLCGVLRGGTFILVYSSSDRRVVADFSLPYWYPADTRDDELDETTEGGPVRPDWTVLNDDIIKLNKGRILTLVDKKLDLVKTDVTDKLGKLDFKITSQADSINKAYSGSVSSVIDAIFKGKTPVATGPVFANPDFSGAANALEGMRGYAEAIDGKIAAGTATDAEKAIRKELDGMMGGIIRETVTKIGSGSGDIAAGSEEERFISLAGENAATIKDPAVRSALVTEMTRLGATAGGAGKVNLSDRMRVFVL